MTNNEDIKKEDSVVDNEIDNNEELETIDSEIQTENEEDIEFEETEDSIEDEIQALKDKNIRLLAEYQNFKKRSTQDVVNAKELGITEAVSELIETLDYMEMAIQHVDFDAQDVDMTARGVQMVIQIFNRKLEGLGVKEIATSGLCDYTLHTPQETECVEELENEAIIRVLKKGYILKDRVIRHAQVVVNKKD